MTSLDVARYDGRFLRLVTEHGRLREPILCKLKPILGRTESFWYSAIIHSTKSGYGLNHFDANSTDERVSGMERYFPTDSAYVVPKKILLSNPPDDNEIMRALTQVTPPVEWPVVDELMLSLTDIRIHYQPRTLV
jgi:hypothetical protein